MNKMVELNDRLRLMPPWLELKAQLNALFGRDPEIQVEYDNGTKKLTLRVETQRKADALSRLLPMRYIFGGVTVPVGIVPGNKGEMLPACTATIDVATAAFEGNGAVKLIRPVSKGLFRDLVYVVFEKEVVQFPNDNLSDINGNKSTLMEEIAREVFTDAVGVCFCTSAGREDANGFGDAPLGEWP